MKRRELIEFWEPVHLKEFKDYYEVSTLGRVRRTKAGPSTRIGKILSGVAFNFAGYPTYNLNNGRKNIVITGHLLVARTFLGECPIGMEINHKDGIKSHNWFTNLEYVTHEENMTHASKLGLMPMGESHGCSKLSEDSVIKIKKYLLSQKYSYSELASMFNISYSIIAKIASGRKWKYVRIEA